VAGWEGGEGEGMKPAYERMSLHLAALFVGDEKEGVMLGFWVCSVFGVGRGDAQARSL